MEIAILISQIVLALLLIFSWNWFKALPDRIHKKQEQTFQQQLSKELELLKISQSQIQPKKLEQFIEFSKLQT